MARPAIAVGVAVVMMETVNDFGTVEFFAVQTLTTGIFTVWFEQNNAGGAAQIATVILVVILMLVMIERLGRRRIRFYQEARQVRPVTPVSLVGPGAWLATLACSIPFAFGFVLPVGVMAGHAVRNSERWIDPKLLSALFSTVWVGLAAAFLTVGARDLHGLRRAVDAPGPAPVADAAHHDRLCRPRRGSGRRSPDPAGSRGQCACR